MMRIALYKNRMEDAHDTEFDPEWWLVCYEGKWALSFHLDGSVEVTAPATPDAWPGNATLFTESDWEAHDEWEKVWAL